MANLITHVNIAKRALELLPEDLKKTISENPNNKAAFLYGSVGPDFLFALRELNDPAARYCNVMQYCRTYEVFASVLEYLTGIKDKKHHETAESYLYGLLCHYVADFKIHPYVNYFVEEVFGKYVDGDQKEGIHSLIESAADTYVVTQIMGYKNANDYSPSKDIKSSFTVKKEIAKLYIGGINKIVGFDVSLYKFIKAICITNVSMRFFTDKKGKKRKLFAKLGKDNTVGKKKALNLLRPPEYYGEIDFLNFEKHPFRKVRNSNEMDDKSMTELMDECVTLTAKYITVFYKALKNGSILNPADYKINYEGVTL